MATAAANLLRMDAKDLTDEIDDARWEALAAASEALGDIAF